jgi:hypothetical protein
MHKYSYLNELPPMNELLMMLMLISLNYLLFTFYPLLVLKPLFVDNNNTPSPSLQEQSCSFNPIIEITSKSTWEFRLFNGVFVVAHHIPPKHLLIIHDILQMFPKNTLMPMMAIQVMVWSLVLVRTCLLLLTALEALFHWQDPLVCLQYTHKQTHA